MANLRSRSRARTVAPTRAALKMEPTIPAPFFITSNHPDLSEAALRKLPRTQLQQLAMAHKVKANLKSEVIIRLLLRLQIPKKTRPAEDDPEEGPSRKRLKRESVGEKVSILQEDQVAPGSDADPQVPEANPSAPRSVSPAQKAPTTLSYDRNLFSGTESEMTEEEQLDYATPVSSRAETPPAANLNGLKRCVTIMSEISAQDVVLLKEATVVRESAAALRKKARDVRNLVKAERGRRERMESYFRYWQETQPSWDREWLYGGHSLSNRSVGSSLRRPAGSQSARPEMRMPRQQPMRRERPSDEESTEAAGELGRREGRQ